MPFADERITIKKEKISSYLVYNFVSLGKITGKAESFSWRQVGCKLAVKYLENLAFEKICDYFKINCSYFKIG